MNAKTFFGLIFGVPTVVLIFIYYELRINNKLNNLWQLFLFCWMVITGYMPGIMIYTYYLEDKIHKALLQS